MKIKFYSPTFSKMVFNDCEEYDNDYWYDDIDDREAAIYRDDIGWNIELDMSKEQTGGLVEYLWVDGSKELENSLKEKVTSCQPTVIKIDGRLYGVMEAEVTEPLTEEETEALFEYCEGQYSDGWGEGFEQRPIETENGDLYVSFWKSNGFYIESEETFAKRIKMPLEQLAEQKTYREEISNTGISMGF